VADVALVAARELGDPIPAVVLVEADDRTFHTARVRTQQIGRFVDQMR
jgi:hypothetical protein